MADKEAQQRTLPDQDTTPTRIPDHLVGHFRLLRSWTRKLEICQKRIATLSHMLQHNNTPRSFQKIIKPAIPEVTTSFSLKWHAIHHKFATELTTCLVSYWEEQQLRCTTEVNHLQTLLKEEASEEVYQHIKDTIRTQLSPKKWTDPRKRKRIEDSPEDTNSS